MFTMDQFPITDLFSAEICRYCYAEFRRKLKCMNDIPEDPFATTLADLLEPLAQAMVARGVTVQAATEALKQALVNAAMYIEGGDTTDSRISLRTGLHRKDVKRLRQDGEKAPSVRSANAVAMTVSYWATAPEYQDADGRPLDLPREGDVGIYDIIRRTRADMAPGTVLATMLDQGVVEALDNNRFRLQTRAFLPDAGGEALVAAYQATLSAHLAAATHNLLAPKGATRHFDRVVRYSHLSPEAVDLLSAAAAEKAQMLLEEINALARELQERDAGSDHTGRFAFGGYVLPTPDTEDGE